MKNYRKESKIGIILSVIALILSIICFFIRVVNSMELGISTTLIGCMFGLLCSNLVLAESKKNTEE